MKTINKKYNIGQTLYFKYCTKEYQLNDIFKPRFIKEQRTIIKNEVEGDYTLIYYIYSENGNTWYQENTLTSVLNDF